MENCNIITPTDSFDYNESQPPVPADLVSSDPQVNVPDNVQPTEPYKKGIPLHLFVIGFLFIMLVMMNIQLHQYRQYCEAIEQEAYLLSVSINLLEDSLLLEYGLFPEDLGFEELRSEWISNPCYETAMPYYEALFSALEYFDEYSEPSHSYDPILV